MDVLASAAMLEGMVICESAGGDSSCNVAGATGEGSAMPEAIDEAMDVDKENIRGERQPRDHRSWPRDAALHHG